MTNLNPHVVPAGELPAGSRLGAVHLRVTDLDRALLVWRDLVGLQVQERLPQGLVFGAGGDALVVLHAGATWPAPHGALGLYHVAIRLSRRQDLARAVARMLAARHRVSPTDHLVGESAYLADADGNGIELAFETPGRGRVEVIDGRARLIASDGALRSGREPIDIEGLMSELSPDDPLTEPLPPDSRLGHVHLHVADLDAGMAFYADTLGFRPNMRFAAAQMYDVGLGPERHVVAFNTWSGADARQPPQEAAGLSWFSLLVPHRAALDNLADRLARANAPLRWIDDSLETQDPAGNRLRIAVSHSFERNDS